MTPLLRWVPREDARHRFAISLVFAAAIFLSLRGHVSLLTQFIATWDAFVVCSLALAWVTILTTPRSRLRAHAKVEDVSRFAIFIFVVMAACAAYTVFSLRYAHIFYGDSDEDAGDQQAYGLDFPGEKIPDYSDFAYFSFVIGMTCQVSDVQVTSGRMRRLTMLHGILSFGFNTVILAMLINTVSGLL